MQILNRRHSAYEVIPIVAKAPSRTLIVAQQSAQPAASWFDACQILQLSLLMIAPLAFGAVQPWAWGALIVGAVALLLLWGLASIGAGKVTLVWSPLYLPMLGVFAVAAVQLAFGLSMDRVGTREALLKLAGYAVLFFVSQQLYASASAGTWRFMAAAVAVYLFLMSLFAIIQFFATPGLLYGAIHAESESVFGPYVNRGNYAGLMEMLIPIVVCFALSLRWRHPAKPFLLFVVFLALVSVSLSGSRAGLISLAVEFGRVGVRVLAGGIDHKRVLVTGILIAVLAGGFFYWLDPGDVLGRWKQVASQPELALGNRQKIALDSLHMSRDHLLHGVGLGAFQIAYTPYQSVVTDLTIDYAHNDYVQFLAEAGIWGWILLPAALVLFFLCSFRGLRARHLSHTRWLQLGAAIGVCGILVHSFSEFNLHIPANAAWFTFLAAVAILPKTAASASSDS